MKLVVTVLISLNCFRICCHLCQLSVGMLVPLMTAIQGHDNGVEYVSSATVLEIRNLSDINTADMCSVPHVLKVKHFDGSVEDNVSVNRVVLNTRPRDPTLLISSLRDLADQIAQLTPSRADIKSELITAVDKDLLSQMITNDAMDPYKDLLPLLQYLQRSILSLQAPRRAPQTEVSIYVIILRSVSCVYLCNSYFYCGTELDL